MVRPGLAIVALAAMAALGPARAEEPPRCKSPKQYYQGECRYEADIAKLKAAERKRRAEEAARKKPPTEAPKDPPKVPVTDPPKVPVTPPGVGVPSTDAPEATTPSVRVRPTGALQTPAGLKWVAIPGASFLMGSPYGDADEQPVRQVTVSPFQMTRAEVTVDQYAACVKARFCDPSGLDTQVVRDAPSGDSAGCNWGRLGNEAHPLNCVNWQQAQDFCTWAGGRLPTEAEWELAASGGTGRMYPWGDEPATCELAVLDNGEPACGLAHTAPVCSKRGASAQHLCDMAGNVWEWVADWYQADAYATRDDAPDPQGPEFGGQRVRRGGGWKDEPEFLRVANRNGLEPVYRSSVLGFRCAAAKR